MMHSMTAYAGSEKSNGELSVSLELRSYNSRHLDITLKVPGGAVCFEDKIRKLIAGRITRGRIEMRFKIEGDAGKETRFQVDEHRAMSLDEAVSRLRERFNWQVTLPVDYLAGAGGVIKPISDETDSEIFRDDDPVDTGAQGRADNGAQIMGI